MTAFFIDDNNNISPIVIIKIPINLFILRLKFIDKLLFNLIEKNPYPIIIVLSQITQPITKKNDEYIKLIEESKN